LSFESISQRNTENRNAMGIIGGAIQRVNEPAVIRLPINIPALFGDDGMQWKSGADLTQQVIFGTLIHFGDQVNATFMFDLVFF